MQMISPRAQAATVGSGSYRADDVQLLLTPIALEHTDPATKEHLIQSGQRHYSEMISVEQAPSPLQQQVYAQALQQGLPRLAREVQALALSLADYQQQLQQPIMLVSLVRAGLPIGVMLKHALHDLGCPVAHVGVSIIRDRGLDPLAYAWLRQRYAYAQLIFVDGWTGKGAIAQELQRSLACDEQYDGVVRLVTLADVAGYAWLTASAEDWLIPSGVLGSTVSGLISRTLYQAEQWHGCGIYTHLQAVDVSVSLIDQVNTVRRAIVASVSAASWSADARLAQHQHAAAAIAWVAAHYQIAQPNRIKPSLAEATRAVMRRLPERILLQQPDDPRTALLRHVAAQQGAVIEVVGQHIAPYHAITLIQQRATSA